ncbi:hypothetical protein Purlil1_13048 [Purpureocillium lilacinum]|uniref:Uncharacterized protein n=1 Tax=Purpureocillium lilacinum TaxID=33203 RepID=A0ABR0BF53_PURLI|nr:hypothetical protein Purlil1_13048 [Purpureocillium lilacinum]
MNKDQAFGHVVLGHRSVPAAPLAPLPGYQAAARRSCHTSWSKPAAARCRRGKARRTTVQHSSDDCRTFSPNSIGTILLCKDRRRHLDPAFLPMEHKHSVCPDAKPSGREAETERIGMMAQYVEHEFTGQPNTAVESARPWNPDCCMVQGALTRQSRELSGERCTEAGT